MITAPFSYGYAAHYSYSQTVVTCRWIIMPRLSIRTSCEYVLYIAHDTHNTDDQHGTVLELLYSSDLLRDIILVRETMSWD